MKIHYDHDNADWPSWYELSECQDKVLITISHATDANRLNVFGGWAWQEPAYCEEGYKLQIDKRAFTLRLFNVILRGSNNESSI